MSELKPIGIVPVNVPTYTWTLLHNVAREAGISPLSAVANILTSLASQPALMQDVLDNSDFYQTTS